MHTDHAITRPSSKPVAMRPIVDRMTWKHYVPLRSVNLFSKCHPSSDWGCDWLSSQPTKVARTNRQGRKKQCSIKLDFRKKLKKFKISSSPYFPAEISWYRCTGLKTCTHGSLIDFQINFHNPCMDLSLVCLYLIQWGKSAKANTPSVTEISERDLCAYTR